MRRMATRTLGQVPSSLLVENDRISRVHSMRNPHELGRLGGPVALSR